jgi:hypothetical protein
MEASRKTSSQNNALESQNLVIKEQDNFRERMPLSGFLFQCLETVEKCSKHYANNDKVFILTPTIELQQWTKAYQRAKRQLSSYIKKSRRKN